MSTNYTINFAATNNNLQDYYVTFVSAAGSPEAFNATFNGASLQASSSINLNSDGNNTIQISSFAWQGDMYISTKPFNANTPVFTNNTDNRFQCLEFSGSDATSMLPGFTIADISYINWYSIPLMMENTNNGDSRGVPLTGFSPNNLLQSLESLSNSLDTTVINDANGNFLRIIGPNACGSYIGTYPTFNDYVNYIFPGYNNYNAFICLQNMFDGSPDGNTINFQRQNYDNYDSSLATNNVYYDGNTLKIQGRTTILSETTDQPTGITTTYTIETPLDMNTFNTGIYLAQLDYSWTMNYIDQNGNPQTLGKIKASVGDNDVFSAIVRDLLAGFAFGFAGSKVPGDYGLNYGQYPSGYWQNVDGSTLFNDLQSATIVNPPPYYYNSWANVFYQYLSRVYSFTFSDFITSINPQLQVNGGENLLVTILS